MTTVTTYFSAGFDRWSPHERIVEVVWDVAQPAPVVVSKRAMTELPEGAALTSPVKLRTYEAILNNIAPFNTPPWVDPPQT